MSTVAKTERRSIREVGECRPYCTQGSIEKFKEHIVEVYEPIEDYRIGKIMDNFLYDFQRKNDQEIIDYC